MSMGVLAKSHSFVVLFVSGYPKYTVTHAILKRFFLKCLNGTSQILWICVMYLCYGMTRVGRAQRFKYILFFSSLPLVLMLVAGASTATSSLLRD